MAIDNCLRCGGKITSLDAGWVHLEAVEFDHEARPEPDLTAKARTPVRGEDAPRLDL